ncbi:MAG: right-handed parallel beta-helix repeat-containing protein [Bdellovibrionales bacterium]|nr:right-handed parallel beta-helix repeat-containing protein [Bdellovibrionales bacterium]
MRSCIILRRPQAPLVALLLLSLFTQSCGPVPEAREFQSSDSELADSDITHQQLTSDASGEELFAVPQILYLSPSGRDAYSGRTPERAVRTLEKIHQIVESQLLTGIVQVRVLPGVYRGQTIVWRYQPEGLSVRFVNWGGSRPLFDGCTTSTTCPGGTWFSFPYGMGYASGFRFDGLRIQNYQTAINLHGNRNNLDRYNGENRIENCEFRNIGNVFNSRLEASTAAVRLVNSDNNLIRDNDFYNIINLGPKGGLLHAIYVAHNSSDNRIMRNRFWNISGDPIRIRDLSNHNDIRDNRFDRSGNYGFSEWYCDSQTRNDCTKATPECPSYGNTFRTNGLNQKFSGGRLGTFNYYQDANSPHCPAIPANERRLRTSSNAGNCGINDCVNRKGRCYQHGTGSAHLQCSEGRWNYCNLNRVGLKRAGKTCTKISATDAQWR